MFVRLMLDDEADAFVALLREHTTSYMAEVPFDEGMARLTFKRYSRTGNPIIWCAEGADRSIVGYALASAARYRFSRAVFTSLESIYVSPADRTSKAGFLLFREYDRWSKDTMGALETKCGIDHGQDTGRTKAFFQHFGLEGCGENLRRFNGQV